MMKHAKKYISAKEHFRSTIDLTSRQVYNGAEEDGNALVQSSSASQSSVTENKSLGQFPRSSTGYHVLSGPDAPLCVHRQATPYVQEGGGDANQQTSIRGISS